MTTTYDPSLPTLTVQNTSSDTCAWDADNVHERTRHYILMPLSLVILLANMAVLRLLACHKHFRRPDLLLIASLCCADLMVGSICIPNIVTGAKESTLQQCLLQVAMMVTSVLISAFTLLAVAVDRLLAIQFALKYNRMVTIRKTVIVLLILWSSGLLTGLLPLFGWNKWKQFYTGYCTVLRVLPFSFLVTIFVLSVFCISAILIIHMYLYAHARVHIRRIDALERVLGQRPSGPLGLSGRSWRSVWTTSGVTGCVIACWGPFLLATTYVLLAPDPPCDLVVVTGTYLLTLGYANSATNPVVYALRNPEIKAIAVKMMKKVCRNNRT